ncbi:UNVERIFIED_CONTAM: heme A synthase [Jeotgalibacillus campisalis]
MILSLSLLLAAAFLTSWCTTSAPTSQAQAFAAAAALAAILVAINIQLASTQGAPVAGSRACTKSPSESK